MTRALGIDIGGFSIKIAEIEVSTRSRELVGLYEIARPPGTEAGPLLGEFFRTSGIAAERVAVGLGQAPVYIKKTELPFNDRKRLVPTIQAELEDVLPFDLADYVLDVKPMPKISKSFRFLVGLCPNGWVEVFNKVCDEAGLTAAGFFVDPEALGQLAIHQNLPAAHAGAHYAVCDLGADSTKIAILKGVLPDPLDRKAKIVEAGEVAEVRTINRGSSELISWIKTRKGMQDEEVRQWLIHRAQIKIESTQVGSAPSDDISDEIKVALRPIVVELYQTLQAYRAKSGAMPSTIYLTGGMSEIRGLRDFLAEELRMSVYPWPIFQGYNTDKVPLSPEKERSFAVALSLANRFAIRRQQGWLNFRRSPQANRRILTTFVEQLTAPVFQPVLLGLVASLVFTFAYGSAAKYFLAQDMDLLTKDLQAELGRLNSNLGIKAKKSDFNPGETRTMLAREKKIKLTAMKAASPGGPQGKAKSDILLEVSQGMPPNSKMRSLNVTEQGAGSQIDAVVELVGPPDMNKVKAGFLDKLKGYSQVQVEASGTPNQVRLRALWKGGAT